MKEILYNLALIETINFCKRNHIDYSGTHLNKKERGYIYTLIKDKTGEKLVSVKFSNNRIPQLFCTIKSTSI